MKANTSPLLPDRYYHIYNRGINGGAIFLKPTHYKLFLSKYISHISSCAETYAYCLMNNHFHFLVQVKSEKEILKSIEKKYPGKEVVSISKWVSSQFAHLFNGYSQTFNKETKRTGGLFESPFRRIEVTNDRYFSQLVAYIHHNPQKHGVVNNFENYPYSSYKAHLSKQETYLERTKVLEWFGGEKPFTDFHKVQMIENSDFPNLILE